MNNQSENVSIMQIADQTCPATGFQKATVCVPVSVRPFANVGDTTTFCCGEPTVTARRTCVSGTPNGTCTFTLTQDICVEVPVTFGARARVGTPSVDCGDVSNEDICTNCGEDDDPPAVSITSSNKSCKTNG